MRIGGIPYLRSPSYLSPSALRQFEESPVRFYLDRCGPLETKPPQDEQGYPAAVGIAFDALVKRAVAETKGLVCPALETMLANVKTERERALETARQLLADYTACGALTLFLEQGPHQLDRELMGTIPDPVDPVPIKGILDVAIVGGVHDWKTKSANTPGEGSPSPGYEIFLGFDGSRKGPHKRHGEPLEALDQGWAAQVTTYAWLLGLQGPIRVSIDEVIVGKGVARFRTIVSVEFQNKLRARYRDAWAAIQEERVVDPKLAVCGLDYVRALKEKSWW